MKRVPRLTLVAVLGLAGCRRAEPPAPAPPPGEVWLTEEQIRGGRLVIAPAGPKTLALHLVTAGRVAFDEARVAHVFSPVSGRVTRVLAGLGQTVRANDPLAVIESPDLASAWSDLVKARADGVAAGRELERENRLFEHGAGAQRELESARNGAEKAEVEITRAELRLKLLHGALDGAPTQEFLLRSPISGDVVNRNVSPGLEVEGMLSSANIAPELFTVGQTDPVWIWGDVYERDLGRVRKGQPVAITSTAYPGRSISGTVDYVTEALDPQTRTARIRCAVPNPERLLKPEMYIKLSLELERRDVLALPRTAVVKMADHQTVFVQDGRAPGGRTRFLQRAVELGDADDGWVGIASGLKAGERVVVSGSILLSGGSE